METDDIAAWLTAIWDTRQSMYDHAPDFEEQAGSARGPGWGTAGGDTCEVCGAYQFSGLENIVEDAWYEHMEQCHQRREVLARIAADRAILAECSIVLEDRDPERVGERVLAWAVVRQLASVHRDRPGWREAWQ